MTPEFYRPSRGKLVSWYDSCSLAYLRRFASVSNCSCQRGHLLLLENKIKSATQKGFRLARQVYTVRCAAREDRQEVPFDEAWSVPPGYQQSRPKVGFHRLRTLDTPSSLALQRTQKNPVDYISNAFLCHSRNFRVQSWLVVNENDVWAKQWWREESNSSVRLIRCQLFPNPSYRTNSLLYHWKFEFVQFIWSFKCDYRGPRHKITKKNIHMRLFVQLRRLPGVVNDHAIASGRNWGKGNDVILRKPSARTNRHLIESLTDWTCKPNCHVIVDDIGVVELDVVVLK